MMHFYPSYYERFRCIAADCPDSCCQGWDVVIDEDTEDYYDAVASDFGEKLRAAIVTDADGDRVFRLREEKKCPFWGEDKLCDIYRELGEEHLCETCARFPRISMAYEGFTEHTLALACPEAARLILGEDGAYRTFTLTAAQGCEDYSAEEMTSLLRFRRRCADILFSDRPLRERLSVLLSDAETAQKTLYGAYDGAGEISFYDLIDGMEYIDEANREKLVSCLGDRPAFSEEAALTRLAAYWLYRYSLSAVDSCDVFSCVKMAVCSVIAVAALSEKHGISVIGAAQLYSKEIEQSYENMERMWDGLRMLSVQSVIKML